MTLVFPECLVNKKPLFDAVKAMAKVPRSLGKDSPLRFLVFGAEESEWIVIRVVDKNIYFECYLNGEGINIAQEGQIAVDIKEFKDVIRRSPENTAIRLSGGWGRGNKPLLTMQAGKKSLTKIAAKNPVGLLNHFPEIENEEEIFVFRPKGLYECLSRNVILSREKGKKNYEEYGLFLQKRSGCVRFVTIDRNRLVLTEAPWSGINEDISSKVLQEVQKGIKLPVGAVEQLLGILPAVSPEALVSFVSSEIRHSNSYTWIVFDGDMVLRINSFVLPGYFPQYSCFTDNKKKIVLEFDTRHLFEAFARLKPLTEFSVMRFSGENSFVNISGIRHKSIFSREPLDYSLLEGELPDKLIIGVKSAYMADALSRIPTGRVKVELGGRKDPIRCSPVFLEEHNYYFSRFTYVAMPLELSMIVQDI